MSEIVKVQRALGGAHAGSNVVLVYAENRRLVQQQREPAACERMAWAHEHKQFFWADWRDGQWHIDVERGFAPWQEW